MDKKSILQKKARAAIKAMPTPVQNPAPAGQPIQPTAAIPATPAAPQTMPMQGGMPQQMPAATPAVPAMPQAGMATPRYPELPKPRIEPQPLQKGGMPAMPKQQPAMPMPHPATPKTPKLPTQIPLRRMPTRRDIIDKLKKKRRGGTKLA